MKKLDKSMQQARLAWALSQRCGAKCRSGLACKNLPVRSKKRCRMHGGLSKGRPPIHGRFAQSTVKALRNCRQLSRELLYAAQHRHHSWEKPDVN